MTVDTRLQRLAAIAELRRDVALVEVARCQTHCALLRTRLEGLQRSSEEDADIPFHIMAEAALRYEGWADVRRARINTELAKGISDLMRAQDEARREFGRAMALVNLQDRLRR
jgi:predicted kinase